MNIPILAGLWYRSLSRLDMALLRKQHIHNPLYKGCKRKEVVIASMTSFPARIETTCWAIKSLMLQTYKPDRIVLWLANEQFPSHKLPANLLELEKYGLEIRWCDDLYGHKKYYYLVTEQKPNELVITFDDDIAYSPLCIERLMRKHQEYPNVVVCERAQSYINEEKAKLNPGRWNTISDVGVKEPSFSLNPSPGGGCLIPYHAFHKDSTDKMKIRELAYKNDDLWYMFMCAENGTKIIKTRKYHKIFTLIEGSQTVQMATENVVGNKNVLCMEKLISHYPKAWERISNKK